MSIQLRNVSFRYESGKQIFSNLSLTIPSSTIVAITGECGSGKSTLVKLIAGLLKPDSGDILLPFGAGNGKRAKFGYLFQNPDDQFVHFNVEREVAFSLENLGLPYGKMRRRVKKALVKIGLWERRGGSPNNLSGGEKQKLALAGMLISNPDILILDEPTSFLDIPTKMQFYNLIKSLSIKNLSIIWITQEKEEIETAEHIIELKDGNIIFEGDSSCYFSDCSNSIISKSDAENLNINYKTPKVKLTIKDLLFKYPDNPEFCLNIPDISHYFKSSLGIYGCSGTGKSTVGKIIAGLLPDYEDNIKLTQCNNRKMFNSLKPKAMYVPQFPEKMFLGEKIKDTISLISSIGEYRNLEEDVKNFLSKFSLNYSEIKNRSGYELSMGELRKFAISLGMGCSPDILILDEPTIGLGQKEEEQLYNCVWDFVNDHSVMIISHDYKILKKFCDEVWILDYGRVIFTGSFEELECNPEIKEKVGLNFLMNMSKKSQHYILK